MSEVKVSVVMPVYNVSKYLEETLNYVLKQTLKEFELICVDDGSTDNSYDILKRYEEQDSRITVLKQQNQYAGVARNNGLSVAKGKYVIFWDSDDIFREDALEKLYIQAEKDNADITICAANKYDEEYDEIVLTNTYLMKDRLPKKIPFSREEIGKYIFGFAANVPWNKLYLKSFVTEHNLQFEARRQANDAYFVMMSLYYATCISVVDETLINYRIGTGSSTTDKASDVPLCACEAYEGVWKALKKTGEYNGDLKQSFVNKMLNCLLYSLSIQGSFESYTTIYNYIKDKLFDEFGFPQEDEEYFYSAGAYADYQVIRAQKVEGFLVYKMKTMSEEMRRKNSKLRATRERRDFLRERRDALREERNQLREERNQLRMELSECKEINKKQKAILDSRTVRYALKTKDILTFKGKSKEEK